MVLSINIPPDAESRLKSEAERQGLEVAEYVARLVVEHLPTPAAGPVRDQATLDLLAQWDREDATDDPEEIARRERDWEELREALNRNRLESGGPNARKVFP
jgi:hypothetical protein